MLEIARARAQRYLDLDAQTRALAALGIAKPRQLLDLCALPGSAGFGGLGLGLGAERRRGAGDKVRF